MGDETYKYAQPGVNDEHRGILPALLDDLAKHRKAAKKAMAEAKAAGDDWTYTIKNAQQIAFKVTMNSAYGFFGATRGYMPCVSVGRRFYRILNGSFVM